MIKRGTMALKTFNLDAAAYAEFSKHCKQHGISMSKKVENFIRDELETLKKPEPEKFTNPVEKERARRQRELQNEHPMERYC